MLKKIFYIAVIIALAISCTQSNVIRIENSKEGMLHSSYQLVLNDTKSFCLDSMTAPRPIYIQLLKNANGEDSILTFLNQYNNSIYFYNYKNSSFLSNIAFNKNDNNKFRRIGGYYYKNRDSIYVYDMAEVKLYLTNMDGTMRQPIQLHDENLNWPLYYPQYMLNTVNPIIENKGKLLMTGQYFPSVPMSIIDKFRFSSYIDLKTNQVEYHSTYPKELYGSGANWEGGISTAVYTVLSPENKVIHSYPVSHNLYISEWNGDACSITYGGSNVAKTISSIDRKETVRTPNELILSHYIQQDMYGGILYDPYRKLYYRFLLQGIPNASLSTLKEEKPISIIIMDDKFNYLGETVIGTGKEWNWKNSFITSEGLNIEYIDKNDVDENYLTFKIFYPKAV
ncbi:MULTISPECIES: DUF4221 family protein [unclassified Bacteroides]|uniref:DUF4221 family protein n=1 Tax=unclassified Bacteroides TaxID=2646097 RepID=UPI0013ED63C5|nr:MULTISPECIES: DUF4221 family protein [unclassified Bacteroides]QTO27152.1 DUF4221 family protein [Bacteroides sp. ZJ-18]